MAANWASGLPRWKPHIVGSRTYSLNHLNPRRIAVDFLERGSLPAATVEVRIGFMSHVFTEACLENEVADPDFSRLNEPRTFSLTRYTLSLHLPRIIETLSGRRCYVSSSGYGNHFVVEGLSGLPAGEEYWIFLQLERLDATIARMRIRSAYAGTRSLAPHGRGRQSMMFRELLARTLGLKKQTPPRGRGSQASAS